MSVSKLLEKNLKISKSQKPDPETKPTNKNRGINHAAQATGNSRAEKDLVLLDIKIKRAELDYEILTKNVILREDIQHVWNKIYKSASYFQDFGQKYSGRWAAALGISDPERISHLQTLIDKSTEEFIESFSETVEREI